METTDEQMEEQLNLILEELKAIRAQLASPDKVFLSKKEVSEMLDLSVATIDRMTKKGMLKVHKIGQRALYKKTEILEAI